MRQQLTLVSAVVFLCILAATVWASTRVGITPAIQELLTQADSGTNPWFIATLTDAYLGFFWFWLWVAYKERHWSARIGWLVGIALTGNMAMAAYMVLALRRLPDSAGVPELLTQRA